MKLLNNRFVSVRVLIMLALVSLSTQMYAQVSEGGSPKSFQYPTLRSSTPQYMADVNFDVQAMLAEDDALEAEGMPPRCARIIPVDLTVENSGLWSELPDGTKIWQLEIYAPEAMAIMLYYDKFIIPQGGRLFIYNKDLSKLLGAYTHTTNTKGAEFATEFVYGDRIVLEYEAPQGELIIPEIEITGVAYGYNHIRVPMQDGSAKYRWDSEPCMINVNCPEGDDWQDQKKGVLRSISPKGEYVGLCSGTLINNTSFDQDPLFLSAFHCYEGVTEEEINQTVYYFNYEYEGCENLGTDPYSKTITGAEYLVSLPISANSDGALLRLSRQIPDNYDAYFNGWDRRNSPAISGVCIHHPAGDVKKISTFKSPATSTTWRAQGVTGATNGYWNVYFSKTETGHSVTEGGSSGSPLFNQNKLVVGTLTGGSSTCNYKNGVNNYGKLWYHWDKSTEGKYMADYLDPTGTGEEYIPGFYNGATPFEADFSYAPEEVVVDLPVKFNDLSYNATSWTWSFEGATPATSTEQSPEVVFNSVGTKQVTLIINQGRPSESTKTMSVEVTPEVAALADFDIDGSSADIVEVFQGEPVIFTNKSKGSRISFSWNFENGTPETSTLKDPEVRFNTLGTFDIELSTQNYLGTNIKNKQVKVNDQAPVAEIISSSNYFTTYPNYGQLLPNAGGKVNLKDESKYFPTSWLWTLQGANETSSNNENVEANYSKEGKYSVTLKVENAKGSSEIVKEDYIQVGGTAQIWNMPVGEKGLTYHKINEDEYLTGTSDHYSVLAEKFENSGSGTITEVDVMMKVVDGDVSERNYIVLIYSDKDGKPGTVIGSANRFSGATINPEGHTTVTLAQPITVSGTFYVAISALGYNENKIAIATSERTKETAYANVGGQWMLLSECFPEGDWSLSLNIVPKYTIEGGSNINNINDYAEIKIYPNPVGDDLTIESSEMIRTVIVSDLQGRKIADYIVNDSFLTIPAQSWNTGIYLIRVETEDSNYVQKVIKK